MEGDIVLAINELLPQCDADLLDLIYRLINKSIEQLSNND